MKHTSYESQQILAQQLVQEAGRMALAGFGRTDVKLKADNSMVTQVDLDIQRMIVDRLTSQFPDHAIVAEETLDEASALSRCRQSPIEPTASRFVWIIDPIDGTRNYALGFPNFATSIAMLDGGRPVVGVIGEHVSGNVYAALLGQGATLMDRQITVRAKPAGHESLIAIPSSKEAITKRVLATWLKRPGIVLRNTGSTALHLALVASGAIHAAYGYRCKIWDIAAGALIVSEAGGVITGLDGSDIFPWSAAGNANANIPFFAGEPKLHSTLLNDFV